MFGVFVTSYIGEKTPEHLVGKAMSLFFASTWLGVAIGNYMSGVLLNHFIATPSIALLIVAGIATACSLFVRIKE